MKIKWFAGLTFLTVLAVTIPNLFSLSRQELIAQPQQQELSQETLEDYAEALEDAASPQKDEVLNNLTAIKSKSPESDPNLYWDANGRVLVITFAAKDDYKKGDPVPKKEIWVTVVPELKELCTIYTKVNPNLDSDALNLRLRQILGLPPHAEFEYEEIAEIWVDPQYLKRPTIDSEIYDSEADLPPSSKTIRNNETDPHRVLLRRQLREQEANKRHADNDDNPKTSPDSYPHPYPWTGLGYTYDWGIDPETGKAVEFGLSEFVILLPSDIDLDSAVEVNRVFSPEVYCDLKK